MVVHFNIFWPGGNTTALVEKRMIHRQQAAVARKIMTHFPQIEQVGFLQTPKRKSSSIRLQMMGNEFCCNATRCAGFYWSKKKRTEELDLEVSALSRTVHALRRGERSSVVLPGTFVVRKRKIAEGTIVDCQGIRHIVIPAKSNVDNKKLIHKYKRDYPAVGIIYTRRQAHNRLAIRPFIWVRDTNSFIAETGCGSGSVAAAIAVQASPKTSTFSIVQPSGSIYRVALTVSGRALSSIALSGRIKHLGRASIRV